MSESTPSPELSVEEEATHLYQMLKEQAGALQGKAITAMAALEVLGLKLIEKKILTLPEAEQIKQDSQRLYDRLIDCEVYSVLSDDKFAEKMKLPELPRKMVLSRLGGSREAVDERPVDRSQDSDSR